MLSHFSLVQLFVALWTAACPAPLSRGLPRQACWSGLPLPPPGKPPSLGIKPGSPALVGGLFTTRATWEAPPGTIDPERR